MSQHRFLTGKDKGVLKPVGLLVVSKEAWSDIRWARKQWLPFYLSACGRVDRAIYLDRHSAWWRGEHFHDPYRDGKIEVYQQLLIWPLERSRYVRALNRRWIASRVLPLLDMKHHWITLYYHPFDFPMMSRIAEKSKVVFDWTEDWAVFHNDQELAYLQRRVVEQADAVLTVSSGLYDQAVAWRGDRGGVFLVPNATAFEPPSSPVREPEDIRDIPHPRVGFFGHAGPWLDARLVARLAAHMPALQWLMVGGRTGKVMHRLGGCANIHWLGVRRPDELVPYMCSCDVLVAPYKKGIQGDATKLYDYLLAGKPIISTRCETSERLQPYVAGCSTFDEWVTALNGAVEGNGGSFQRIPDDVILANHWRTRASQVAGIFQRLLDG